MRRGGLGRLVQHLGITLVILELAHIPLPAPECHHRKASAQSAESASSRGTAANLPASPDRADVDAIVWHWTTLEPLGDGDDAGLATSEVEGDRACSVASGDPHKCPCLASQTRARSHHLVRGHWSKGITKILEGNPHFVGLADAGDSGFHASPDDGDHAPRAAMLQRWRC
jgi:hypothetical protein